MPTACGVVFGLGLRAGAPPLARYGSGDVALAPGEVPVRCAAARAA